MGFTGPDGALQVLGVTLIGVTPENGVKVLLTAAFILAAWLAGRLLSALVGQATKASHFPRTVFWSRQAVQILTVVAALIGVTSIWFDDPTRLTTAAGLVTAGLAFALQRVVTAIAGYFVILRGVTFNVGDRIVMGGVRGDVIALGFMQTTVMEMGQPASVEGADPAIWVRGRHYTGRIVTISNAKIFDEPVYNYTREFPFLFEEIRVPVHPADGPRAEAILLAVAKTHSQPIVDLGAPELLELQRRYFLEPTEPTPQVFWRLTDNWLELAVRFLARDHDVRRLKDLMTRDIISGFAAAGIPIASTSLEIVGLPELQLVRARPAAGATGPAAGSHSLDKPARSTSSPSTSRT